MRLRSSHNKLEIPVFKIKRRARLASWLRCIAASPNKGAGSFSRWPRLSGSRPSLSRRQKVFFDRFAAGVCLFKILLALFRTVFTDFLPTVSLTIFMDFLTSPVGKETPTQRGRRSFSNEHQPPFNCPVPRAIFLLGVRLFYMKVDSLKKKLVHGRSLDPS